MEFLKKHYEKILLGVVLLGLTVAVALLLFLLSSKRAELEAARGTRLDPKIQPYPKLDTSALEAPLLRIKTPIRFDFTTHDHNLVNPVLWSRDASGRIRKGQIREAGPEALEILAINPLYLRLTFNSVFGTSYLIDVEDETVPANKPRKTQRQAAKDEKKDLFTVREVKGPADKPTGLGLELADGQKISLAPGTPFQRVAGYEVDLKYPGEQPNKVWRKQRRDATLTFGGEQYKIVAITSSNIVVSANRNEKKTTINLKP